MATLNELKQALEGQMPPGWEYYAYPVGAVDNPTDLTEQGIFTLTYDRDATHVDWSLAQWFGVRFWRTGTLNRGIYVFCWADRARAVTDPDAYVAEIITAATRRVAEVTA